MDLGCRLSPALTQALLPLPPTGKVYQWEDPTPSSLTTGMARNLRPPWTPQLPSTSAVGRCTRSCSCRASTTAPTSRASSRPALKVGARRPHLCFGGQLLLPGVRGPRRGPQVGAHGGEGPQQEETPAWLNRQPLLPQATWASCSEGQRDSWTPCCRCLSWPRPAQPAPAHTHHRIYIHPATHQQKLYTLQDGTQGQLLLWPRTRVSPCQALSTLTQRVPTVADVVMNRCLDTTVAGGVYISRIHTSVAPGISRSSRCPSWRSSASPHTRESGCLAGNLALQGGAVAAVCG